MMCIVLVEGVNCCRRIMSQMSVYTFLQALVSKEHVATFGIGHVTVLIAKQNQNESTCTHSDSVGDTGFPAILR